MTDAILPGSIAVTFDDGYADNLHCAARLLQKHDVPATFFLTSGYLGGHEEFWWDELTRLVFDPVVLPSKLSILPCLAGR